MYVGNVPHVCGGVRNENHCQVYDAATDSWQLGSSMGPKNHSVGGYTKSSDFGLVLAGDYGLYGEAVSSTTDGSDFSRSPIPDLPGRTMFNCLASSPDGGRVFNMGGSNLVNNQDHSAYVWRPGQYSWYSLPNMTYGREGFGCGVVTDPNGKSFLVVAGGNAEARTSTEMLDLDAMEQWVEGENPIGLVMVCYPVIYVFSDCSGLSFS